KIVDDSSSSDDESDSSESSSDSVRVTNGSRRGGDHLRRKSYLPRITSNMKWLFAIILGLLFFFFAMCITYQFTNCVAGGLCMPGTLNDDGTCCLYGVFIH